ncbi:hypothetical protein QYE76_040909 [Lolium multiflorum]|uniref:Ribonuclease H1 N-terminal domain-containing protein n=1 Tax=Lolium multiflorum TaxID=4521 RepID=A0AAD8TCS2_LOLMU|nr:hypothetical protein QYE76_040909 [Lolium multiflorum]
MRDSQLEEGSRTQTKAVQYLQSFMLRNKEKNILLLPIFPEDKYCTLVILCPKWSLAQYFDSSNTTTKKDYKRIRGVLDEAILGYSKNGGTFDKKGEFIRPDTGKLGFKHVIDFPCIKQAADIMKEDFYVLHHLKGFVADAEMMSLPPSMRDPNKMAGEINDADLREDFHRIQMTYYVVFEGRVPGVYEEWEDCKKQGLPLLRTEPIPCRLRHPETATLRISRRLSETTTRGAGDPEESILGNLSPNSDDASSIGTEEYNRLTKELEIGESADDASSMNTEEYNRKLKELGGGEQPDAYSAQPMQVLATAAPLDQ